MTIFTSRKHALPPPPSDRARASCFHPNKGFSTELMVAVLTAVPSFPLPACWSLLSVSELVHVNSVSTHIEILNTFNGRLPSSVGIAKVSWHL